MKASAKFEDSEQPASGVVLQPDLAAIDEHAKDDLSAAVVNALYPDLYPEFEDRAQDEALSRQASRTTGHHRAVVVPGEAFKQP